jgi:hypothetical protein
MEPPTKPESATSTFPKEYLDSGSPKLHWSMDFKYDRETKLGRLTFTAKNEEHNEPVVFEYIKVTLVPPAGTKRCLFNGDKWEKESRTLFEKAAHLFGIAKEGLLGLFTDDDEDAEDEEATKTDDAKPAETTPPGAPPAGSTQGSTPAGGDTSTPPASGEQPTTSTPSTNPSDEKPATTTPATSKPAKKQRTIFSAGNVYLLGRSKGWVGDDDLEMTVKANKRSLAVDAMIGRPDDQPFSVARGESLTIVLQGQLDGVGMWPIKVREAWQVKDPEQMGKEVSASDDWKIVQIFDDGRKPDYFDISDRQKKNTTG